METKIMLKTLNTKLFAAVFVVATLVAASAYSYLALHDRTTNSNYTSIKVINYNLAFKINPDELTQVGRVLYSLQAKVGGNSIVFDSKNINVSRVIEDGAEGTKTVELEFEVDRQRDTLTVFRDYQEGESFSFIVEMSVKGELGRREGVVWVAGEEGKRGNNSAIASFYTQLQAINARQLLPCQDTPQALSTFTTTLTYPEHLEGFASGDRIELDDETEVDDAVVNNEGTKTSKFSTSFEIPPYLYAIMIGPLESVKISDTVEVVARPDVIDNALILAAHTTEIIETYENYLGIDLQVPTMRLGFIPHNDYAYGAMENMGFIFFNESRYVVSAEAAANPAARLVLAHELAHHWFGNLLTTNSWQSVFVNEGPTSFLHTWYLEQSDDFSDEEVEVTMGTRSWQGVRDMLMGLPDVAERGFFAHMNQDPRLLDGLEMPSFLQVYTKGPWIFREVRYQIGDDGVRYVLQNLLPEEKALISNDGFVEEITTLMQQYANSTGIPLANLRTGFIEDLVFEPGIPMLDVKCERTPTGRLKVVVTQDVLDVTPKNSPRTILRTYDLGPLLVSSYPGNQATEFSMAENALETTLYFDQYIDGVFIDAKGERLVQVDYDGCFENVSGFEAKESDWRLKHEQIKAEKAQVAAEAEAKKAAEMTDDEIDAVLKANDAD
jgi:aminopeptidase N